MKTEPKIVYQISADDFDELLDKAMKRAAARFAIVAPAGTAKDETEELFDVTSLARFLKVAPCTIYANPNIPKMKRGKRNYYLKSDILLWLKGGRQKTPSEIDKEVDQFVKKKMKKV